MRCGSGTYQLSLNRAQVASRIDGMATAVVARINSAAGLFADVLDASDFVAELMTVAKRPQFSANETARTSLGPACSQSTQPTDPSSWPAASEHSRRRPRCLVPVP